MEATLSVKGTTVVSADNHLHTCFLSQLPLHAGMLKKQLTKEKSQVITQPALAQAAQYKLLVKKNATCDSQLRLPSALVKSRIAMHWYVQSLVHNSNSKP